MKTRLFFILTTGCLLATSCCDKPVTPKDYIIFGDFYGMCAGSFCVDYYKIENGVLYKDQLDEYPIGSINHQFNTYNTPYNSSILDICSELPTGIYAEGESVGMPDAYDQGGLYVEISNSGNIQNWKIDKDDANVPAYLHNLCDSVKHYLSVLN